MMASDTPNPGSRRIKLLSRLHYVVAAKSILYSYIPSHALFRSLFGPAEDRTEETDVIIALIIIVGLFWIIAVMLLFAARCLLTYRHRFFCLAMAEISIVLFPIGTIVGTLTVIALAKPENVQRFKHNTFQINSPDEAKGNNLL